MYDFEKLLERNENGSKKWNSKYISERFGVNTEKNFYPMFIADMDFRIPEDLLKSILNLVEFNFDLGYFDVRNETFESIINWYKNNYSCLIDRRWILPSIGVISLIGVAINKILTRGDGVLVFTPVYSPFRDVILNNEMKLVCENLLLEDCRYFIDFKNLENNIVKNNVKGIIFCNPHNPSGRCWSKQELEHLINLCKRNNVLIISDEVHGDILIGENKFVSLSNYFDVYDKIIVVSSPNKTFNVAGLNISFLVCKNDFMRNEIDRSLNEKKLHVNRFSVECLTIFYRDGYNWVNDLRICIRENIKLAVDIISEVPSISIVSPDAGYLLWVKLNLVEDIDDFIFKLAKHKNVFLESGSRFITNYKNFLRINVATSKKLLREGIKLFLDFYKQYVKEKEIY